MILSQLWRILLPGKKYKTREQSTIGIANMTTWRWGGVENRLVMQFYDFDGELDSNIFVKTIDEIRKIFPNDCLIFKSKNGYHFISFTLLDKKPKFVRKRASKLSKKLGQNYTSEMQALVLRIAPKFKERQIVSERPKYYTILKFPRKDTPIAKNHLELYHEYLRIPEHIYNYYIKHCTLIHAELNLVYYRTGEIIDEEVKD